MKTGVNTCLNNIEVKGNRLYEHFPFTDVIIQVSLMAFIKKLRSKNIKKLNS